eukprot:2686548-Rhodomonas_salina.1
MIVLRSVPLNVLQTVAIVLQVLVSATSSLQNPIFPAVCPPHERTKGFLTSDSDFWKIGSRDSLEPFVQKKLGV